MQSGTINPKINIEYRYLSIILFQDTSMHQLFTDRDWQRNNWFETSDSVSKSEPRINDFDKLFRNKESRNSLSDSLVRTIE